MKIVNLTTHPIRVETESGIIEYPASGRVLKLTTLEETVCEVGSGIPVVRKVFFEPDELPPKIDGTFYIVPNQVAQVIQRSDFISPDTKRSYGARRNNDGTVLSVRRFRVYDEMRKYG